MLMRLICFFCAFVVPLHWAAAASGDLGRRLFDFTPVSASNPVVATIDGWIEIPLSELRGYRDAERPKALSESPTVAQKRAILDDLITEYLLVDDAYRTGVTTMPAFTKRMEATHTMLLTDFMAARAENEAKSGPTSDAAASPPPAGAAEAMADRLFEATDVEISNEAFAILKRGAQKIDAAREASSRGPVVEPEREAAAKLRAAIAETPDAVLARYVNKSISVRQVLVIYAGMPAPRPNLQTQAGVVQMIKPLITPELMAIEATKRGIETEPAFQAKLIQNRNALLRFHMQGLIDRRANEAMRAPDFPAQLRAWYEAHRAEYRLPPEKGGAIPSYADVAQRVEADYSVALVERLKAEQAAALRQLHRVAVDEDALKVW